MQKYWKPGSEEEQTSGTWLEMDMESRDKWQRFPNDSSIHFHFLSQGFS